MDGPNIESRIVSDGEPNWLKNEALAEVKQHKGDKAAITHPINRNYTLACEPSVDGPGASLACCALPLSLPEGRPGVVRQSAGHPLATVAPQACARHWLARGTIRAM